MYGSSLRLVTRTPREARIAARDAAAMPFPSEETTPPVTNTNLVIGWPVQEIRILPEPRDATKRGCARRSAFAFGAWFADVRARHEVATTPRRGPPPCVRASPPGLPIAARRRSRAS